MADNGPYEQQHDCGTSARMASLMYQPPGMAFCGMSVVTDTNPTRSQSQPGGMDAVTIIEPVLAKAARQPARHGSGDDAPHQRANRTGPGRPAGQGGRCGVVTSPFVQEALDRGGRSASTGCS